MTVKKSLGEYRMTDNKDKIKTIMASVFGVSPDMIDETSSQDTILTWDSMNHLCLITAIEKQFPVLFTMSEIFRMYSLNDILDILKGKGKT
jgi:acyl carrier protein